MRPADHLLEYRLSHTVISTSSSTHITLPDGHSGRLCVGNIPNLANRILLYYGYPHRFKCELAKASNSQRPRAYSSSHIYALHAIQDCSRQIHHGVNESNTEASFLASFTLLMHTYTCHMYDILQEYNLKKTGELWLLQWLKQYRGVRAIKPPVGSGSNGVCP
jgi:hypothetical protein